MRILEPEFEGFRRFNRIPIKDLPNIGMSPDHTYYYRGKKYGSVTVMLRRLPGKARPPRQNWGSRGSAKVGLEYHCLVERYLSGRLRREVAYRPFAYAHNPWSLFIQSVPYLNRIDNIEGIEQRLISKKWRVAGTADVIAEFDGVPSVIDHKTASSDLDLDQMEKYVLQTGIYAILWGEMTGRRAKNSVILLHNWSGRSMAIINPIEMIEDKCRGILDAAAK